MARLDDVNLDTEDAKIIREHHFFAIDLDRNQEKHHTIISKVTEILEKAVDEGEIAGYHFDWNFDQNVTEEYK